MRHSRLLLTGVWLALSLAALALVGRELRSPGLYYDEALQAGPAREFLAGAAHGRHLPGTQSTVLFGRPFPLFALPYLGALKSHLLMGPFAVFGSSVEVLRLTTLVAALTGLLFALLWIFEWARAGPALLCGLLVVFDPCFLLASRHDWGPFAFGFLLRSAALLCVTAGWKRQRTSLLACGGLCAGLAVYHKFDAAIVLLAALVAALACRGASLLDRVRGRPRILVVPVLAGAVGMAPVFANLPRILATSQALGAPGDSQEKLAVVRAILDGSYFQRLMLTGGRFDAMFSIDAPQWTPLGVLLLISVGVLILCVVRAALDGRLDRGAVFVLASTALGVGAFAVLPGAVRLHHWMNLYPLPHLAIALAATRAWCAAIPQLGTHPVRGVVLIGIVLPVASNVRALERTLSFLDETGGRGRWSSSIHELARRYESDPDTVLVSLDWGTHEPLLFLTSGPDLVEPVWALRGIEPGRTVWSMEGSPRHVYLVYEDPYSLFSIGTRFLEAVARLDPREVVLERFADRTGSDTLVSVRLARPHRVVYSGSFRIESR